MLTESDIAFMRAMKLVQSDETATAKAKLLQGHYNSWAQPAEVEPYVYQVSGPGQQPQGIGQ